MAELSPQTYHMRERNPITWHGAFEKYVFFGASKCLFLFHVLRREGKMYWSPRQTGGDSSKKEILFFKRATLPPRLSWLPKTLFRPWMGGMTGVGGLKKRLDSKTILQSVTLLACSSPLSKRKRAKRKKVKKAFPCSEEEEREKSKKRRKEKWRRSEASDHARSTGKAFAKYGKRCLPKQ